MYKVVKLLVKYSKTDFNSKGIYQMTALYIGI